MPSQVTTTPLISPYVFTADVPVPAPKPAAFAYSAPAFALLAPLTEMPGHLRLRSRRPRQDVPAPWQVEPAGQSPMVKMPLDVVFVIAHEHVAPEVSILSRDLRAALAGPAVLEQLDRYTELLIDALPSDAPDGRPRSQVPVTMRMANLINLLGMPPGLGGNGVLGLPDSAMKRTLMDRLRTAARLFGYDTRLDPDLQMPRLYDDLLGHARETDDFLALLGRPPDANGHGGIGIRALPLHEQRPLLNRLCRRVDLAWNDRALPAIAEAVVAADATSGMTSLIEKVRRHGWLNRDEVAMLRVFQAACTESPLRNIRALLALGSKLCRLPIEMGERALAYDAHLRTLQSIGPAAASLLADRTVTSAELERWAGDIINDIPGELTPPGAWVVEPILRAFEAPDHIFQIARARSDGRRIRWLAGQPERTTRLSFPPPR